MLKKLLKYELTFMSKFLMIYYIITFSLAVLTRIFFAIATTTFLLIMAKIFQGAFLGCVISTIINVLMQYWVRFRRNLYGDESYLTHTLPIEKRTLYASKTLGGIVTMFTTVIFSIGCIFIAYGTPENFAWIKNTFTAVETALNSSLGWLIALVCVLVLIQFLMLILSGFLGMVLGHRFHRSRVGLSVLFGIIAYVASGVLLVLVIAIVGCFDPLIKGILISTQTPPADVLTTLVCIAIVVYMIATVAIYLLGNKIFEKGVNVD